MRLKTEFQESWAPQVLVKEVLGTRLTEGTLSQWLG